MLENLSPAARECFDAAKSEARRLKHANLNTRHLLLGLIQRQKAMIDELHQPYELSADQVTQVVIESVGQGGMDSPRRLKVSFAKEGIEITFDSAIVDYVVAAGFDQRLGARRLERVIQRQILEPLAEETYKPDWGQTSRVTVF